jgi:hypothetical protein
MNKLHFTQHINASRERVWEVLWSPGTYPKWTAPFGEGGRMETDFKQGSRVLFLSPEGDGMIGRLDRVHEPAILSITHQGVYQDGKEQPYDEATREWSGAKEQYALLESGAHTDLRVDIDVVDDEVDSFNELFPKALAILKRLAEGKAKEL